MLGWYNPFESVPERHLLVKADRVQHWLDLGAQMTENAEALIKQAAPAIVRKKTEKVLAHRAKAAAKRKASKKAAA